MTTEIEELIEKEEWEAARKVIQKSLSETPDDHWLLTRLGLTYYEQRNYKKALEIHEQAFSYNPKCPLVLWDYAGTLQMLEEHKKAILLFKKITNKGINRIAYGECGEGKAWARGLVADCYYRISQSLREMGDYHESLKYLQRHLKLRGPGCRSIYSYKDITAEYKKEKTKAQPSN